MCIYTYTHTIHTQGFQNPRGVHPGNKKPALDLPVYPPVPVLRLFVRAVRVGHKLRAYGRKLRKPLRYAAQLRNKIGHIPADGQSPIGVTVGS
jgi:hypothetical protein